MDYLSVERARMISEVCRKSVQMKSSAAWNIAVGTAGGDRQVIELARTWALLMQEAIQTKYRSVGVAANETVGEALQYCNIKGVRAHDILKILSLTVRVLVLGWDYGEQLDTWWNSVPEVRHRLSSD